MKYKNTTSIPDKVVKAVIKAVIKAVAPIPLRRLRFALYDHRCDRHQTFGFFRTTNYSINIHLPRTERSAMFLGPWSTTDQRAVFRTRIEALVSILAHEIRHVEQYNRDISHNLDPEVLYRAVPEAYEEDAEDYSIRMLSLFRQGKILPGLRNWSRQKCLRAENTKLMPSPSLSAGDP